ncbi:MBL fold metallo-hydrolase [Chitinophaga sancti]|uniref:MBL fold metallo-hydrolase n=1 Tax=Chitinophaga sancti TaxID=1004 RepID=A0A1K1R6D0_9BACT|nr:MBL fold metallo-hydrolase [Chitinophaga sancti]WQD64196.1 MBL fold metallo-hydrolase [Chitinophaga sancti]WQG90180.1 MBL fold metallo-hydrolase [Chitinophaga sancti]SFW67565.1 Phosphoribosyl 1,2-cyclic phosphodiesterase [Chitinophaga sancti]
MSLYITSLNSGSNGNCYYIGNDHEAIMVDAGLSCRETERRMHRLGLSMQKVKALFISHEHTDHIKGITILSKKYNLPVYITPATQRSGNLPLAEQQAIPFLPYTPVQIGGLSITAFPKFHDAVEPHSFIISGNEVNIGVFTDIGAPCEHLIRHFQICHAAFLEANYDEVMLENGSYPFHLKRRIRGGHGHLSNKQALELFKAHRPPYMTHLFLSHLSKDNNDPDVVLELFRPHAGDTHVAVASRYQETPVYNISNNGKLGPVRYTQLSIF